MARSKHRKKHKAIKRNANIKKQKIREMVNEAVKNAEKNPVSYTYHKDATYVKVPIQAWQMLNDCAIKLEALARFVSVMEQVGNSHMTDGTLLPVFEDDLESVPGAKPTPDGRIPRKIKDSFWIRGSKEKESPIEQPPLLVDPSGEPITTETAE